MEGRPRLAALLDHLLVVAELLQGGGAQLRFVRRSTPVEASRVLAERSGARLVVLAPSVGSKPEARDYLSLFDHNVELLAAALAESP